MTKREEFEVLLERSRRFCEAAKIFFDRGFHDLACFALEQCLQLYLKAALLFHGMDPPRTHSIRRLLEYLYAVSEKPEIREIMERYAVELSLLEDAYITARYVPKEFTRGEVERLLRVVEEVLGIVRRVIS